MIIKGELIKQLHGKGSKSEHEAIFLLGEDYKYRLKMKGGNPFYDKELHKLVGKKVVIEGNFDSVLFVVDSLNVQ